MMEAQQIISFKPRAVTLYFEFKDENITNNEIHSLIDEAMMVARDGIKFPGNLDITVQTIDSIEDEFGFCIKRQAIFDAKSVKADTLISVPGEISNDNVKSLIKGAFVELNAFDALKQAAITVRDHE